jgi:hypothetical protein
MRISRRFLTAGLTSIFLGLGLLAAPSSQAAPAVVTGSCPDYYGCLRTELGSIQGWNYSNQDVANRTWSSTHWVGERYIRNRNHASRRIVVARNANNLCAILAYDNRGWVPLPANFGNVTSFTVGHTVGCAQNIWL